MKALRVLLRSGALAACTLGWTAVWLVGLPFAAWAGRGERWRARIFQSWARVCTQVIGMRVEREGPLPAGPVLLVSNHLGYVDIVLIASQLRCVFVSKAEVGSWPVLGVLSRWMQTLFVDRGLRRDVLRVSEQVRERLERGQSVVLFPEGTSSGGSGVLRFHSALLASAASGERAVYHATLRYFTPEGAPPPAEVICWWGDMRFGSHVRRLLAVRSFRARIAFGPEPIQDTDRKSLARRLHAEVASRFGSLRESEESCLIGA